MVFATVSDPLWTWDDALPAALLMCIGTAITIADPRKPFGAGPHTPLKPSQNRRETLATLAEKAAAQAHARASDGAGKAQWVRGFAGAGDASSAIALWEVAGTRSALGWIDQGDVDIAANAAVLACELLGHVAPEGGL
jgi:hypothetical protein